MNQLRDGFSKVTKNQSGKLMVRRGHVNRWKHFGKLTKNWLPRQIWKENQLFFVVMYVHTLHDFLTDTENWNCEPIQYSRIHCKTNNQLQLYRNFILDSGVYNFDIRACFSQYFSDDLEHWKKTNYVQVFRIKVILLCTVDVLITYNESGVEITWKRHQS
jgi:hypothetical protein